MKKQSSKDMAKKYPVKHRAAHKAKAARDWHQDRPKQAGSELPDDVLIGRNAVIEALKHGRGINKILLAEGDREGSVNEIVALAKERGIMLQTVARTKLESLAAGQRHQGVLAYVAPVPYVELDDILARAADKGEPPFLLLLDELEDPHNLGALLRTADAVGVHGVLIPKRRSVPLTSTVAKTSAGAVEYVPVARIGNIAQTLRALKEKGIWAVGADMAGTDDYYDADLTGPLVIVVGSEGKGISRLVKETCDFLVRIPMQGKINSLNASVAGSILLYESLHQRRLKH
jgi:23S rRNA (guanosine2251-2'-O)-methyltransferase